MNVDMKYVINVDEKQQESKDTTLWHTDNTGSKLQGWLL